MKTVGIFCAVVAFAGFLFMLSERSRWIRDRDEQCATAAPLIAASASKQRVLDTIGQASGPSVSHWAEIERLFGPNSDTTYDARRWLSEGGSAIIYSRSNSIMFIYFSANEQAVHASCFLQ